MRVILLSGGSGSRLWPLSNTVRAKQFLKVLRDPDGNAESMLQRVVRQLRETGLTDDQITIVTSQSQVDCIDRQLPGDVSVVVEPERRNTFPAIVLSVMYLLSEKKVDETETVIVMPVDVFTEQGYFDTFYTMDQCVSQGVADLALMGIKPVSPSQKYGYIVPAAETDTGWIRVDYFVEKPRQELAEKLLEKNAFWNGGVFAFRGSWIKKLLLDYSVGNTYASVRANYHLLNKNSFDYEVVEKAANIAVVPFQGLWQDLGTWDALTERMEESSSGNVTLDENSKGVHVINELGIPLVALGMKDTVICATPDGILVSAKESSTRLKDYVPETSSRPMYEHRRWGKYRVLDYTQFGPEKKMLTKHLIIENGKKISYQRHTLRDEVWTVVNGAGEIVLDGTKKIIHAGDVIRINAGRKHSIQGLHDLHVIEVQTGSELTEEDIERFDEEVEREPGAGENRQTDK